MTSSPHRRRNPHRRLSASPSARRTGHRPRIWYLGAAVLTAIAAVTLSAPAALSAPVTAVSGPRPLAAAVTSPAPATWTTVPPPPGLTWTTVATENQHTCAIDSARVLWCWGANAFGQLGNGTRVDSATPVQVVSHGRTWASVDVGNEHSCGIGDDSNWYCWGNGDNEQMGDGHGSNDTVPSQLGPGVPWTGVFLGGDYSCSYRFGTELFCYGDHGAGPAGDFTGVSPGRRNICAISSGSDPGSLWCWTYDTDRTPIYRRIGHRSDWTSVSTGDGAGCGIRSGGTLWCWGSSGIRQIGARTSWVKVSTGADHACAIDSGQGLWCWGHGVNRGRSATVTGGVPIRMRPGVRWQAVSAGIGHTYALTTEGVLWYRT